MEGVRGVVWDGGGGGGRGGGEGCSVRAVYGRAAQAWHLTLTPSLTRGCKGCGARTWSSISAALARQWRSRTAARRSVGASFSPWELPPPSPPMPHSSSRCTEAHRPPSCASACSMPQSSSMTSAPKLRKDLPHGVGEAWAAWAAWAAWEAWEAGGGARCQHPTRAPGGSSPAAKTKEEAGEGLEGVALRRRIVLLAQPHAALGEEPPRHRPQPVCGHRGDVRLDPLGVDLEAEELGPAGRADVLAAPERLVRRHHLLPQVGAVAQLVPLHHAAWRGAVARCTCTEQLIHPHSAAP